MYVGKNQINWIEDNGLCTGCGTCAGICPNSAIEMTIDEKGVYVPKINNEKCNNCSKCLKVCPGWAINFDNLNKETFGRGPDNLLLGNFKNCYLAYSTNSEIRYNSSSGGTITSLLLFALELGLIDGALVTRMDKKNPLKSEPFIARTKEEIIEASKSKYCPVPTNILIKEILKQNGKVAFVGLPCHINGITMAEKIDKDLREKIAFHLGLFCSHNNSYCATEFLLNKLNIRKDNVKEIKYRCRGWPGGILIELNNGGEKFIPNQSSFWNSISNGFFFTPPSCLKCKDVTSELADISFGDPWLPEILAREKEGISILISRSEQGHLLINSAISNEKIEIKQIDVKKVIKSQQTFLHFKKFNIDSRMKLLKANDERINALSTLKMDNDMYNKLIAVIPLINSYFCSKKQVRVLLKYVPIMVFRTYVSFYYLIYSKIIKRDFEKYERKWV